MTHPASRAAAAAVVVLLIMVGALLVRSVEAVPEPTPVRVALAQERWGSPAISNDGTLIADRPTDEGPIRIRRLEDGRTVDVPARGDGAPLAFSPDGRMLLFFDEAGMKRVPVDGGAPIEVLEVYPGGGATWGEDGTIVYSGLDGLYALDDEGGDPVRLLDRGYMSVASPRFLPGGSHLVFTRWGADVPSGAEIVVLDRASGELTPLVEDAASPHFVWPDVLLFGRPGRGLYGVAFDPDATTVLGEPVLLLDSVAVDVAAAGFQASRNGVMLAVIGEQIDTETAAELVMVTPGGTARPLGLRVTPPAAARISPDGTRIAYPAADGGAYIHELSIGRATPVEAYEGPFFIPSWHASSDSIVFTNMSAGAFEMLAVPVDGGPAREMFAGLGRSFALGWSPDGSRILFQTAQAGGTDFDLGVVERDPEPVPAPYLDAPWVEALGALSPDGRWVAYNGADDGDIHLQLRSFPQPGPAYPLGSGPVSGPLMVVQPRWAADMGGVFWQSDAGIMMTPVTLEPTVTVGEPILYLEGTFAPGFDVDAQGRVLVAQRTAALGSGTAEPRPDRPRWRYELFVNWRDRIREMVHQGG